jgi:hypothetical protein
VSKGLLGLLAFMLLAAGCAQEGKLVDTPLPVNGVAWDIVSVRDTTISSVITKVVDVNFKISVHAMSPCEAQRGLLELSRIGSTANPVFSLRPVARYNLDDRCTANPPGESDTVLTLKVAALPINNAQAIDFQVLTSDGLAIQTPIDSTNHSPTAGTTQFEVRVETKARLPVVGATVTIERTGATPAVLGTGVTDATGAYVLQTPSSGIAQLPTIPYRVTVTDGVTTRVISVPAFPARTQLRERVVVRL